MTNSEFIAWFMGFTQRIKGRPSKKDWEEIARSVEGIQGTSTIKAWFTGLTSKIRGVPSDKDWRTIKEFISAASDDAGSKHGRLKSLFDSFESSADALKTGVQKKAR